MEKWARKKARAKTSSPPGARQPSAQAGVDLIEHRGAWAEVLLGQRIERRIHSVETVVQVLGLAVDIEQAGNDLPLGGMLLQEAHGAQAVVGVVVGSDLLERQLGAVMLLDHFDRARLIG